MDAMPNQVVVTVMDALLDVSYALCEPVVLTSAGAITAGPARAITPLSMDGIYAGARLLVGVYPNREAITVSSASGATFTADFSRSHDAGDPIVGATFPSGQPDKPLFTTDEVLGYIGDAQDDFMLLVRPMYGTSLVASVENRRIYDSPSDCIRIERIAIDGTVLQFVSQRDLDMLEPTWASKVGQPKRWFQDEVDNLKFGVYPLPDKQYYMELWFSQRVSNTVTLAGNLLIPPIFYHYVVEGTMAYIFNKDGEQRDQQRAAYFSKRADFGAMLGQVFMDAKRVPKAQGRVPAKFSPMMIGATQQQAPNPQQSAPDMAPEAQ